MSLIKLDSAKFTVNFQKSAYSGDADCESERISFQGVDLFVKLNPRYVNVSGNLQLVANLCAKCSTDVNVDIMFGLQLWIPEKDICYFSVQKHFTSRKSTTIPQLLEEDSDTYRAIIPTEYIQPEHEAHSKFFREGKLTFVIQLKFNKPCEKITSWNEKIPISLFDPTTSDFAIVVGSVRIPCHKVILSLTSPVFKAMFENQMQESVSNEIVISDFSEEVVRSFLKCIYDPSAAFSELESSFAFAQDLLHISIKYQAKDMMDQATNFIVQNIDADTVLDILTFAEQFDFQTVKCEALNFMVKNAKLFLKRRDILKTLHLDLVSEFLAR